MARGLLIAWMVFVGVAPVLAEPIALSFEDGLTGWDITVPTGIANGEGVCERSTVCASGQIVTLNELRYFDPIQINGRAILPVDGQYFAGILAGSDFYVTPPQGNFDMRHTLTLTAGESLSGWSSLANPSGFGSLYAAWVAVLDQDGNELAQPWSAQAVAGQIVQGWTSWEWTPTISGDYTLVLGASLRNTPTATYALHDAIRVAEPSTWLLTLLGATVAIVLTGQHAGNSNAPRSSVPSPPRVHPSASTVFPAG